MAPAEYKTCVSTHPGHISRSELYRPKEAENDRDDVDEVREYWSPLVSEEIEYLSFQDTDLETKQKEDTLTWLVQI